MDIISFWHNANTSLLTKYYITGHRGNASFFADFLKIDIPHKTPPIRSVDSAVLDSGNRMLHLYDPKKRHPQHKRGMAFLFAYQAVTAIG
jgi:hypothetical protein